MRSVLVSGAARGLGAAVVERLRADGYAVLATDLHEAPGIVGLDVREPEQWLAAAESLAALGEPWGLVNSAARTVVRDLFAIDADEWDDVLATNLRGPFLGIQAIGRLLQECGGGRIVNIASDSAFRGIGVTGALRGVEGGADHAHPPRRRRARRLRRDGERDRSGNARRRDRARAGR